MIPRTLIFLIAPIAALNASAQTFEPVSPAFRIEETIASYRGADSLDYLAFPAIVRASETEVLISYKRGRSHARDLGASLEIIRVDLGSGDTIQSPIQLGIPNEIMQMGEWIRFPDGSLATYIDAQTVDAKGQHTRTGLVRALFQPEGSEFGELERVGLIDGVEYGYLFDSATVDKRVYALVMTFEYLAGGRRSVDSLYTDDNGVTWQFQKNLSAEFGDIRINESSLHPFEDGFIVATRGYDNQQRLHRVDRAFNLIHETNLTEETPAIAAYMGRPRIFTYQNKFFLIGRNWRTPDRQTPMELGLVRFDPNDLTVEAQFVLDNAEQGKVTDGYYPCPLIFNTDSGDRLNVFDYRAFLGNAPDIVRFQFDASEFLD